MRIFIRQQLSGIWILRSFIPDHVKENGDIAHLSGIKTYTMLSLLGVECFHILGSEIFKLSRQAKEDVDQHAMDYIRELKKVSAPTRAIADRLGDIFDVHYTSKDVINRAQKINMFD
jgi:hypothetical protein